MISVETSRSGAPVIRKDGRYLGSSIDPLKEGARWAEACAMKLGDCRQVVIFGLGSGYHVLAFLERFAGVSVAVLESDTEVAREALRLHPSLPRSSIVIERDWKNVLERVPLRAYTRGTFRILKHVPSCQGDSEYYERAEGLLLARDRSGFLLQLRDREALLRALDPSKLDALPHAPVSVKTVLGALKPAQSDETAEREALIWRALGELIR